MSVNWRESYEMFRNPSGAVGYSAEGAKKGKAQAAFSVFAYEVTFSGIPTLQGTCRRQTLRAPSVL